MAVLVLSRKVGQKIMVPSCGMTISVENVRGNRVSLGITAPPELTVHREEVYRRIEENRIAVPARDGNEAA
jgi:carbon storage regulator